MTKWIKRVLVGLLVLLVVAISLVWGLFESWRGGIASRMEHGGETIGTEAGPIEYVSYGDGVPALWLHGTPGGYDQVLRTLQLSRDGASRFRSIIPSRPGYLGTPLESGASVEQQSQLFGSLLDRLGIARVVVVGSSGGGPYALDFARRFPQRCSALVLISALSMTTRREPAPPSVVARFFGTPTGRDFGIWLVRDSFPRSIAHIDLSDGVTRSYAAAMMESAIPTRRRIAGFDNDWRSFADLDALRIDEIAAPTIVFHGTADTNVPFVHAQNSAKRIPGAKLVTFEGYDHFIYITRRAEIAAKIDALVHSLAPNPLQ